MGGRVQAALSQLAQAMTDMTQEQMQAGANTLRQQGALLAGSAAGFLEGITLLASTRLCPNVPAQYAVQANGLSGHGILLLVWIFHGRTPARHFDIRANRARSGAP